MRRSKKYQREERPLDTARLMGYTRTEERSDGLQYKVHHIRAAKKEYLCPGCNTTIYVGEAHEVAWTEEGLFGVGSGQRDRRHWHTSCWRARDRRR